MCTRSGISFYPSFPPLAEPMDRLEAKLDALAEQLTQSFNHRFDQITQSNAQLNRRFDCIGDRLITLERAHMSRSEPKLETSYPPLPHSRRAPYFDHPRSYEPRPYVSMIHRYQPSVNRLTLSRPTHSTPLVHQNNIKEEVHEIDLELVDLDHIQTETILEGQLVKDPESTNESEEEVHEVKIDLVDEYEKQLGEESHDTDTTVELPEETLEENEVIEPSPEILEREKSSEDIVFSIQYPQKESPSPTPVKDLFPEIDDPSFHPLDLLVPIGITQCPNHKIGPISLGLFFEFSSYFHTNLKSDSYFLPFPEPSRVSRAMRLHFIEITRLHELLEAIPFASYFWYTLWHLLGVHCKFSCAY